MPCFHFIADRQLAIAVSVSKILLTASIALIVVGCGGSSRFVLDTEFDSPPVKTGTIMSDALRCLRDQLEQDTANTSSYVFMIRDIIDGTIKHNNYSDGPLADAGRLQLMNTLAAYTKPSYGVVIDQFPFMFKPVLNEQVGLNRFGLPSEENVNSFLSQVTHTVNRNRSLKGMPTVNVVTPLIIDGAFTRFDSSHTRSEGYSQNAGYRGDVDDEESGAIDFGKSGSERSITLVINIIDPISNMLVGTEGFDLKFYSNSKKARFRIAINEYYYGFSNTEVAVETPHAAQQTLLDAASVWILDNAFGHQVEFSTCFGDNDKILSLGKDARYEQALLARTLVGGGVVAAATPASDAAIVAAEPDAHAQQQATPVNGEEVEVIPSPPEESIAIEPIAESDERLIEIEAPVVEQLEPTVGNEAISEADDWLFNQPQGSYTLQIASFVEEANADSFNHLLNEAVKSNVRRFSTTQSGQDWTHFIYGQYAAVEDALADSIDLGYKGSWVRTIGSLQHIRCANLEKSGGTYPFCL